MPGVVISKRSDLDTTRGRRPNLLVLGASGHVTQAFLRRPGGRRAQFGCLVLLDRSEHVLKDPLLEPGRLRWPDDGTHRDQLRRRAAGVVLDLTDMDMLPVLAATDAAAAAASYVNTALNDANCGVADTVAAVHPTRQRPRRALHIISSGMNPGAVEAIEQRTEEHDVGRPVFTKPIE